MALAAIAFHLVLSFVHIHPWVRPAQPLAALEISDESPASDAPLQPDSDGYCAICANIAAFASLDLPGSPGLAPVANLMGACRFPTLSLYLERRIAYRLFQTRAPPSAGRPRRF